MGTLDAIAKTKAILNLTEEATNLLAEEIKNAAQRSPFGAITIANTVLEKAMEGKSLVHIIGWLKGY